MNNACGWAALGMVLSLSAGAADWPSVLPDGGDGGAPTNMMHRYWQRRAEKAAEACDAARKRLASRDDIAVYQARLRQSFVEALGGFPERTPLLARTVGVVPRTGYRIEKILFESQPGFYVTGLLYVPDKIGKPVPGVLVPCGHSAGGKDMDTYQLICVQLVKSGMVALLCDPIDQGERMQLLDADGKPRVSGTAAHSRLGVGSILLGRSTATFRIWDGMRALDYLSQRPEVDAARIGCTGNSGGGTLTSYLMALDPRVRVAAPACYITDFRCVVERIGPQDAEQNIFGQLAFGMDHAEYLTMRAPAPTLVCCATHDFFAIEGTRSSVEKARRVYALLNASDRLAVCEAEAPHGFSPVLRAGAVAWMKRWLLNDPSPVPEAAGEPLLRGREAWCTPEGQVLRLPGARSAYDLNRALNDSWVAQRAARWQRSKAEGLAAVRTVTGIRRLSELPPCPLEKTGTFRRAGVTVETCVLRPEPDIALPALVFMPDTSASRITVYVNGAGKAADAEGAIAALVRQGTVVLSVDLRGLGETQGGVLCDRDDKLGREWKDAFAAYLLGTSYLAARTEDLLVCARAAATYGGVNRTVDLVAVGQTVPSALHAAALEPGLFHRVTLRSGIRSWTEVLAAPLAENQLVQTVHGALKVYDLPDLVRGLPESAVEIQSPLTLVP